MKTLTQAFRNDNEDKVKEMQDLGKKINEIMKELKPSRSKRPAPSEEVKAKLADVKLAKNTLDVARKTLHEDLKGKSKEDKEALIKAFKESQKEKHEELKVAQKALAKEVRERIQTKDRRE